MINTDIKKKKYNSIIITSVFIIYIFAFTIGSIVTKDRKFSDMENRNLQMMPELSLETLKSGEFMSGFETYMSDQIMLKDELVKLNTSYSALLNQKSINGVNFTKGDMIIQDYNKPYGQIDINIDYINMFVENNPEFKYTWLVVPNASEIYKEELLNQAIVYNQTEVIEYLSEKANPSIQVVNVLNALMEHKDEYIYYNTDHHWTMYGAYLGYVELCNQLGVIPTDYDLYERETASDNFYGSLYSKAPLFSQKPDMLEFYNNPDGEYEVEYVNENISSNSLYARDNLNIKDKYTAYLDGNHPLIKISSNSSNEEKLLVIKDSYANTLLPLLADNFSEIHVVDLRYYHSNVSDYAMENEILNIVFINNLDFISTDNNFLWLN